MPYLFFKKDGRGDSSWEKVEIHSELSDSVSNKRSIRLKKVLREGRGEEEYGKLWQLVLVPYTEGPKKRFALIGSGVFRVNGKRIRAGIRVLKHKDDIMIGRSHVYYSAQSLVRAEPFRPREQGSRRISCPVCGDAIEEGQTIVRCPQCQILYHQQEDRACWSSIPECATYGCGCLTQLYDQKLWIPG
ncbi:MAG: RING finger protein [Candidatus Glassbacteria bacterium]